jgi:hypothetical protein
MSNAKRNLLALALLILTIMAVYVTGQQPAEVAPVISTSLPDIIGIHPGMPAQEAYSILKTHYPRAHIGIGQYSGMGAKPVPVLIAVYDKDKYPSETVTVWLTTPPSKQTEPQLYLKSRCTTDR